MADNLYWVWLSESCQYNSGSFDKLMRRFPSARAVYEATDEEILSVIGKENAETARLSRRDLSDARRIMDYCMMTDTGIVAYNDEDYPKTLRLLGDPPPVLYYRGKRPHWNDRLRIAVVGTRRMSEYGKRMTFEIAHDLSRAGAIVVTGMALGIDGVASAAATAGGTDTVAVLGSGIDIIYPREHERLYHEIEKRGTILSEFAPGTPPDRRNFPRRNRIISGLTQGTLIIEGNRSSGALITAECAEKQGRDVFALPGNADEENSESTTILLKRGAKPVTCADDIIRIYEPVYPLNLSMLKLLEKTRVKAEKTLTALRVSARAAYPDYRTRREEPAPKKAPSAESLAKNDYSEEKTPAKKKPMSAPSPLEKEDEAVIRAKEEEREKLLDPASLAVYKKMPRGRAVTVDEICAAGFPAHEVMTALTLLEIHKCVTAAPGGRYIRN